MALERSALVREAGRTSGGKGPTAVLYELNPRAGWVVGIDVGRRWVRAAIADLTGEIAARHDERTKAAGARTLIAQVGGAAHALAAEAGIDWKQVTVATVGSAGVLEPSSGQVALAHNLPGWGRPGLLEALRAELGTNVTFENDVNLAAMGERWRGLGKEVDHFVYLHIGTGVGMALVLNGELFRGATGAAGVVAAARAAGMRATLSAKGVFTAARKGDAVALSVVGAVAERIALAIAAVVPVVDPELVVLGGGIGRNGDLLLDPLERELREISPFHPRIEVSALGEDAELQGAVALALRSAQDRLFER